MAETSSRELVEARNRTEIKRLEYMISTDELAILELRQQIANKETNLKASREAMKKAEANIAALDKQPPDMEEEVNDG